MKYIREFTCAITALVAVPASAETYICRGDGGVEQRVDASGDGLTMSGADGTRVLCGSGAKEGTCKIENGRFTFKADFELIFFKKILQRWELDIYDVMSDSSKISTCVADEPKAAGPRRRRQG